MLSTVYFTRFTSWQDAQTHCETQQMTLRQYDGALSDSDIRRWHYNNAQEFDKILFLGLKRNSEVGHLNVACSILDAQLMN